MISRQFFTNELKEINFDEKETFKKEFVDIFADFNQENSRNSKENAKKTGELAKKTSSDFENFLGFGGNNQNIKEESYFFDEKKQSFNENIGFFEDFNKNSIENNKKEINSPENFGFFGENSQNPFVNNNKENFYIEKAENSKENNFFEDIENKNVMNLDDFGDFDKENSKENSQENSENEIKQAFQTNPFNEFISKPVIEENTKKITNNIIDFWKEEEPFKEKSIDINKENNEKMNEFHKENNNEFKENNVITEDLFDNFQDLKSDKNSENMENSTEFFHNNNNISPKHEEIQIKIEEKPHSLQKITENLENKLDFWENLKITQIFQKSKEENSQINPNQGVNILEKYENMQRTPSSLHRGSFEEEDFHQIISPNEIKHGFFEENKEKSIENSRKSLRNFNENEDFNEVFIEKNLISLREIYGDQEKNVIRRDSNEKMIKKQESLERNNDFYLIKPDFEEKPQEI